MSFPIDIRCFSWNVAGLKNFELYVQDMMSKHINKETNIVVVHLQESPNLKNIITLEGFELKEHIMLNSNLMGSFIIRTYLFVRKNVSKLVTIEPSVIREGFYSKKSKINLITTKGILDLNLTIDNKALSFVNIHNFAPTKVSDESILKSHFTNQYQQVEDELNNITKQFNEIYYYLVSDIELNGTKLNEINQNFVKIINHTNEILKNISDNVLRSKFTLFLKDIQITMRNFKNLDIDMSLLEDVKRRIDKYPMKLTEYLDRTMKDIDNKKLTLKNTPVKIDEDFEIDQDFDSQIISKVADYAESSKRHVFLFGDLNSRNLASEGSKIYTKFQLPNHKYEPVISNDYLLQNPQHYIGLTLDSNLSVPTYKVYGVKDNEIIYSNVENCSERKIFPTSFPDRLLYSSNLTVIPSRTLDKWFIAVNNASTTLLSDHIPITFGIKLDVEVEVKTVYVFNRTPHAKALSSSY